MKSPITKKIFKICDFIHFRRFLFIYSQPHRPTTVEHHVQNGDKGSRYHGYRKYNQYFFLKFLFSFQKKHFSVFTALF